MKKGLTWFIILVVVAFVATVLILVYNHCNRQEKGVVASDRDLQNVHASIFNQMKSEGLAFEKYGELVIQALDVGMSGRYGEAGSRAAFQWIQEQNPSIDSKALEKLQVVIEAGYNKFEATQRTKIDKIRIYEEFLDSVPWGSIGKLLGWPKIDLEDLSKVIVTKETKETFETKEMETIDPFSKKKDNK